MTQLVLLLLFSFGVWWVVAPKSVIRFYNWFHRGLTPRQRPKPVAIRVLGLLWLVLLGVLYFFS